MVSQEYETIEEVVTSCAQRLNSGHNDQPCRIGNSSKTPIYLKNVFYKKWADFYY